jgi:hypothetical protein
VRRGPRRGMMGEELSKALEPLPKGEGGILVLLSLQ